MGKTIKLGVTVNSVGRMSCRLSNDRIEKVYAQGNAIPVKAGKAKVKYNLVSAKKSFKSKFKVNAKTGTVTVKKGTAKGVYQIKAKVKDAGNVNYKAKSVTRTAKIKVR